MSQKMMLLFSAGVLVLLLPLFSDLVLAKISKDFKDCPQFFYKGIKPSAYTGTQYQPICQSYMNQSRFATMYHRDHLAPAYSAYRLQASTETGDQNDWKYEPQLVSEDRSPEMDLFTPTPAEDVKKSQAVPDDYHSSPPDPVYTRGHLAPVSHQRTLVDREATYTLTNIVPQKEGSNNGPWSDLENRMLNKFNQHCRGEMYVITGIIPYQKVRMLKERVSIPEYMWSAYCCPTYIPAPNEHFDHIYAAVGRNDPNSGNDIVERGINSEGYDVKEMTVEALEKILATRLFMGIKLFSKECHPK